ncbi:Uncharacterised protein [Salmonella enterica subsp. enterica serovar Bovismorbificans]|nr:Uncharacterised protein [Salmonella enterica subsp. enterica serovar Bovismorbificans]
MQPHIVLLAQIFAFGDTVSDAIARDAAQQIHRALRQLLRPKLFRRSINGVAHPVNNGQAVIQFLTLGIV